MSTKSTIRQGDVLLVPIDMPTAADLKKLKKVRPEVGRFVLAHGEATGHAHTVPVKDCRLLQTSETHRFLLVKAPTQLTHQEHAPLWLQEDTCYRVIRQREYVRETPGMPLEVRYVRD